MPDAARRVHRPGEMAGHRMRLRGIDVSTRAALNSPPEDARDILRRAGRLLDDLEIDVILDGTDQELVMDIAAMRSRLRKLADTEAAAE